MVTMLWCVYAWLWVMVAGNDVDAEGMVALAPALGKLVALTSLNLSGSWLHTCCVGRLVGGVGCTQWVTCGVGGVVRVTVDDGCRERCGC